MTRKSKREIEQQLDDRESTEGTEDLTVGYNNAGSDTVVDDSGEQVDKSDVDVVINRSLVKPREEAIEEGYEILGPAEDTPEGVDAVRVVPKQEREI